MDSVIDEERTQQMIAPTTATDRLTRATAGLHTALASAWPALAGYALVRFVGLITLYVWARAEGKSVVMLLGSRSDSIWYVGIAEHGYDLGRRLQSDMAFFPLFPALISSIEPVLPIGPQATGVAISWLASLAAAWGLFVVGHHLYGRRVGILLAVVWGVLPHAVVESMAYTEAMFTAFAAWSLFAVLTGRWVMAGSICLLAGLTRPTASALIPVIVLAAAIAIFRRRDGWRPWAALLLAPVGWVGYLAWVAEQTGRTDGWFHIQKAGWGTSWDGGRYTIKTAAKVLTDAPALTIYVVTLLLLISVALFVLSVIDRQPWQLLLFSALMVATSLGASGYYHSKARFLLPGFALLLPIAGSLAKAGTSKVYVVVGSLALVSAHFGAYLLLVWTYSP